MINIRWFFCAPGAAILPFATVMNSRVWDSYHGPRVGPGEQTGPLFGTFVDGSPPPWAAGEPYDELAQILPPQMTMEIVAVTHPRVPPIGAVGDKFLFVRRQFPGNPYWEGPFMPALDVVFGNDLQMTLQGIGGGNTFGLGQFPLGSDYVWIDVPQSFPIPKWVGTPEEWDNGAEFPGTPAGAFANGLCIECGGARWHAEGIAIGNVLAGDIPGEQWDVILRLGGFTAPPAPPVPTLVLWDTFTDFDGTLLTAHVMDIGPGWTVFNGTWEIQSNGVVELVGLPASCVAASDALASNVVIRVTVFIQPATWIAAMIAGRVIDQDNCWLCGIESDDQGVTYYIFLVERNGGVQTLRGTAPVDPGVSGTAVILTLTCNVQSITLDRDGVESVNFPAATYNETETIHGIAIYRGGVYASTDFDNFEVESI